MTVAMRIPVPEQSLARPAAADDDGSLVASARDGDAASFEQLYRAHAPRVFALCLRLTADRQRAIELTQDVFIRAWENLAGFRGDSALALVSIRCAICGATQASGRSSSA